MATFYVDRDGRGGVNGSDTTWTVAARAGDATKPFASIQAAMQQITAANTAGGDTIMIRKEVSATPYVGPTLASVSPTTKNTIKGYSSGSTVERPTISGFKLTSCNRWRWEGTLQVGTMWLVTCTAPEIVNNLGRNRGGGSAAMGNVLTDGVSSMVFQGNDIQYTGPLEGLTGSIVALNMRDVTGFAQNSNQITGNRFDRFPGDFINMPVENPGQADFTGWKINNNEFGRNYNVTLASGATPHADILQIEGNTDALEFMYNVIYGDGWGRLMVMPRQNGTGQSAGWGRHNNMKVIGNVWLATTGNAAVFYNTPGLQFISNTMQPASTATDRLKIQFSQGMASGQLMPPSLGTVNVRMKNNYIRGLSVVDYGGTVTFTSDTGFNMFPAAAQHTNYTKRASDVYGTPTWVDTTFDAATGQQPNMHLAAGSRGINEGPTIGNATEMTGIPTTDADGKGYVGTKVDIGPYEFGGTDTTGGGTGDPGTGGGSTGTAGPDLGTAAFSEGTQDPWTNPANALEETGNLYATRGLNSAVNTGISQSLRVSGFNLSRPSSATITGLTVTVERKQNTAQQIHDNSIRLYANGALVGSDKASATIWPTVSTPATYGGASDLWGLTSTALTNAVNAADFSVVVQAKNDSGVSATAAVDWVKAQVSWQTTVVTPTSPPTGSLVVSPNPTVAGTDITFNTAGSTGQITTREISLNGGTTYTISLPTGDTSFTTALVAGTYSAVLRVTGPGGTHVTSPQVVLVGTTTVPAPNSSFTLSASTVTEGSSFTVDTSLSSGSITKREVSFDGGFTWINLGAATTYTSVLPRGTYTVIVRMTGPGGASVSQPQTLTVTVVDTPPAPSQYVPYSPQIGCKYVLTSPSGARAVFNDKTDVDYVGDLSDMTGLDSAEVRESATDLVQSDGGTHGDFYFGRRPVTMTARVYNAAGPLDRDYRIDKIRRVIKECLRSDGVLSWQNNPLTSTLAMQTWVRMQQPLRVTGNWVKDVQISLVSAYAPLFSAQIQSTGAVNLGDSKLSVVNRGDYTAYPILTLAGSSSLISGAGDIAFYNTVTGKVFRLTSDFILRKGEVVEFDMLNHTGVVKTRSTAAGTQRAAGTDLSQYIDFDTTNWPVVAPGSNNLSATASKASGETASVLGTYTVTYRHSWA